MKKLHLFLLISIVGVLTSCDQNKYAPIIISVKAVPDSVLLSESLSLECEASDGDSDPLTYQWACLVGDFTAGSKASTVIWKAPQDSGRYEIVIAVSDGKYITTDKVFVQVNKKIEKEGYFTYHGQEYEFATLGLQTWMIDNMAYLPEVHDPLDGDEENAYYYVYDYYGTDVNEAERRDNYEEYGVLYNWVAAMDVCPDDWHLPSDDEWKTLERFLGMGTEVDERGWRDGGSVGKKMKTRSGWIEDGNGTNTSGFSAKPGGLKTFSGDFSDGGGYGNYWSSTLEDPSTAWYRYLGHPFDGVNRNFSSKRRGFSVRCIRD